MPIVVDIDVMLARRKMAVGTLADRVGITPANLAVLKNGRAKAVRFTTLEALCEVLECQPGDLLRWEPEAHEADVASPSRHSDDRGPGLTKQYGDVLAVDDLSFDVEQGQVTGFLGPNGAGKSTTMRMVLGLDRPTSGQALVNGRPFASYAEPLREVGALLDPGSVHPGRTGRNHLRVAARTNGIRERRVDEVIEQVGLDGAARRRIKGYSLGMRQRLGHRRGAARRPAGAAVRRADQRARPRRRPVDPRPAAAARRRGPHGAGLEPPDERDAADRRPAGRHRARAG